MSHRLPTTAMPSRYDIRLTPDLEAGTFTGEETVAVTVREAVEEIVLNAADLVVDAVRIERGGSPAVEGSATLEPEAERARLRFPRRVEPGEWTLTLRFHGPLNEQLHGFYRSTWKDADGHPHTLAATQFEAVDARRAFPCWDEPAAKAVFAVTLVVPEGYAAISNTRILRETPAGPGRRAVTFADTIRMSTYLVAFFVGELEASDPVMVGPTPIRVWSVPGKRALSGFALEAAAFCLRFFEEYYGIPYPGDKLDLLGIPDFASGAMENLGAITFRETALLVDRAAASHSELARVADVVAHEVAHMWFGDLATMAWWNGIWLNEAFATFMEMLAVDAWKPEWERWVSFGVARAGAFAVDGLRASRPIEFPVEAPRDCEAMFDLLTYEKGASVLRMLEQYLGPETFRRGVRLYLERHAYANAETTDLWRALGDAAGQPIPAVMDGWVFQPGYPLVTVEPTPGGLRLAQEHFTYLPAASGAPRETWKVPLSLRVASAGRVSEHRVLLDGATTELRLPGAADWVVANAGGHGFYRVAYGGGLRDRLLAALDQLEAIERFGLVGDLWAMAVAGRLGAVDYVELTARLRNEPDRNVWVLILGSFGYVNRAIEDSARPGLAALVRDRLGPAAARLGWEPRPGERELTRQLRGDVLRALGTLGDDPATRERARELFARHRDDPTAVDPNVWPAVIATVAAGGGEADYAECLERFHRARTPQEEQRYLYALAGFRSPDLLGQTLERTVNGEIRSQDAPFVVRALLTSVWGRGLAWEFVQRHWETMARLYPPSAYRWMWDGVTGLTRPKWEVEVRAFFPAHGIHLGGKVLDQYLEELSIGVRFHEREAATLAAHLGRPR
jgi:puromycin-sensitive aminopeptidase